MSTYTVSASSPVAAPPDRVYGIIADYHQGHPAILPRAFTGLKVEKGGVGSGTVINVTMRMFGREYSFRGFVTEPTPGRVLVERNVGVNTPDSLTTFTVDPGGAPGESIVTISSEFAARKGLAGTIERALASRMIKRMYHEELRLLDAAASRPT